MEPVQDAVGGAQRAAAASLKASEELPVIYGIDAKRAWFLPGVGGVVARKM
jgi:hypothetical protein